MTLAFAAIHDQGILPLCVASPHICTGIMKQRKHGGATRSRGWHKGGTHQHNTAHAAARVTAHLHQELRQHVRWVRQQVLLELWAVHGTVAATAWEGRKGLEHDITTDASCVSTGTLDARHQHLHPTSASFAVTNTLFTITRHRAKYRIGDSVASSSPPSRVAVPGLMGVCTRRASSERVEYREKCRGNCWVLTGTKHPSCRHVTHEHPGATM